MRPSTPLPATGIDTPVAARSSPFGTGTLPSPNPGPSSACGWSAKAWRSHRKGSMAKNEQRRRLLADAGLAVLAGEGSRGLTHRAIDEAASVPLGTASNYFRSREALIAGLVDRIGERLAPEPEMLERLAAEPPSRRLFSDYLRDIVRRLTEEREVTLALFELRLESTRRPGVAAVLGEWQRAAFEADIAFNTA